MNVRQVTCRRGGTGRRAGLKILWWQHRTGSIPVAGIVKISSDVDNLFFYNIVLYVVAIVYIYTVNSYMMKNKQWNIITMLVYTLTVNIVQ